ncbi:SDR family NAD(P)-dependent oxidoreductase [Cupriavidus necator]|uniref:SDR family NAD(P)-dependent oxidoreductase n=1 Tax=Cupriavidus necator TaxID=106590 RepID=UPI00339D5061
MTTRVLEGKTALVTGGGGGIGAASALALLRDGAAVVLMGRRREALEAARRSLCAQLPGATVAISVGDACREDDVQAALQQAAAVYGEAALQAVLAGRIPDTGRRGTTQGDKR